MIKWFQNEKEANDWMRAHPEAHMVCMSSGSISGSLFVGFLVPPSVSSAPAPDMSAEQTMLELAKHQQAELDNAATKPTVIDGHWGSPVSEASAWGDMASSDKSPKRRGRPPKVKI